MQRLLVVSSVLLGALVFGAPSFAYAQLEGNVDQHVRHELFGLNPIVMAFAITITGVTLKIFMEYNKRQGKGMTLANVANRMIIAFFASSAMVNTQLQHIPIGISDLSLMSILTSTLATVIGVDYGVSKVAGQLHNGGMRLPGRNGPKEPTEGMVKGSENIGPVGPVQRHTVGPDSPSSVDKSQINSEDVVRIGEHKYVKMD